MISPVGGVKIAFEAFKAPKALRIMPACWSSHVLHFIRYHSASCTTTAEIFLLSYANSLVLLDEDHDFHFFRSKRNVKISLLKETRNFWSMSKQGIRWRLIGNNGGVLARTYFLSSTKHFTEKKIKLLRSSWTLIMNEKGENYEKLKNSAALALNPDKSRITAGTK